MQMFEQNSSKARVTWAADHVGSAGCYKKMCYQIWSVPI